MSLKLFQMKLSIIIPVYNEERTIIEILERVNNFKKDNSQYEVIIINDGSKDKTLDLLKKNSHLYNNLVSYEKNKGKGYAVKEGLKFSKGEYVIFQDADLEYDPLEIQGFMDLIEKFNPDGTIGSRFVYNKYTRSHYFLNKIGNKLLTLIFNIFYNTTFTDVYSCYFCFKKKLLDDKKLETHGFEQHAEILCKVIKKGKIFYEIPISYNGRSHDEGKKIKFYHFFIVVLRIIIERIKS